jgi:hypothetical protein
MTDNNVNQRTWSGAEIKLALSEERIAMHEKLEHSLVPVKDSLIRIEENQKNTMVSV